MSTSEPDSVDGLTLEDLIGDPPPEAALAPATKPKPKQARRGRKPGRPRGSEVSDAAFVAAYLEHDGNATAAYQALHPNVARSTAGTEGHRMLQRVGVKQELAERTEAARQLATKKVVYDLTKAHDEICERIDAASDAGQHTAVASLMREKLRLWKLIDSRDNVAQAGFSITIHSADGETKVVGTAPEGEPQ